MKFPRLRAYHEDIIQNAMINAFRFWDKLRANPDTEWKTIRGWFFRVVYNEGLAMLRRGAGSNARTMPFSEYRGFELCLNWDDDAIEDNPYVFIDKVASVPPTREEELDARRVIKDVIKLALKKKGAPLILSCLGYEHHEVAKMLGTTKPAVKSRTNRTRQIIRERYEAA